MEKQLATTEAQRPSDPERPPWAAFWFRLAPSAVWRFGLCVLVGLVGCSHTSKSKNDPLLGVATPKPPATAQAKPDSNKSAALPPLPPTSATSPAALATSRPLEGGNELRIGTASNPGTTPPSTPTGWQGQPPPPPPTNWQTPSAPPASVPGPRSQAIPPASLPTASAIEPVSRRDPILARGAAPLSMPPVMSYEQAQAILLSRGVKWQRLETWGDRGEWKFSCSIPNRQNPFISRTYEGRATDYLSAVRAVLGQIDNETN